MNRARICNYSATRMDRSRWDHAFHSYLDVPTPIHPSRYYREVYTMQLREGFDLGNTYDPAKSDPSGLHCSNELTAKKHQSMNNDMRYKVAQYKQPWLVHDIKHKFICQLLHLSAINHKYICVF